MNGVVDVKSLSLQKSQPINAQWINGSQEYNQGLIPLTLW